MKKNIQWIEYLRAIACIMVVILHLSGNYIYALSPKSNTWHIFNFINSFTRTCVPIFFMITGFIFIKKTDISIRHFLRLAACIIFYSSISIIFLALYKNANILDEVKKSFFSPVIYHLWFFYALIPCYFFFILYRNKSQEGNLISLKELIFFLTFIFLLLSYNSESQIKLLGLSNLVKFPVNSEIAFYIIYAIIGAELGSRKTHNIKSSHLILIFFVSTMLIFSGTQLLSERKGWLDSSYYSHNTLLVSLSSVSIFLLLKNNELKVNVKTRGILIKIARISLPVYGIHAIFVVYFRHLNIFDNQISDFTVKLIITLSLSILISASIKWFDKRSIIS